MKCPMLMYNYLPNESPTAGIHSDCLQAECAWWYKDGARCTIHDAGLTLNLIEEALSDIRDSLEKGGKR